MTIRAGVLVAKLVPEKWLLVVLLATVLKGLVWSAAIPEGQGPDEPSHVALVQFIAEQHRLPQRADTYRADELLYLRRLSQADVIEGQRNAQQEFSDTQLGPSEARILALPPELRNSFESRSYVSAMFVPPLYHWFASLPYRLVYSASVLDRVFAMSLANQILPARLGELSYVYLARRTQGLPVGHGLASLLIARLFDLLAIGLLYWWVPSLCSVSCPRRTWSTSGQLRAPRHL